MGRARRLGFFFLFGLMLVVPVRLRGEIGTDRDIQAPNVTAYFFAGDVLSFAGKDYFVLALDRYDASGRPDGLVDDVFYFHTDEASFAPSIKASGAAIEFWGDRLRVTLPDEGVIYDFRVKGQSSFRRQGATGHLKDADSTTAILNVPEFATRIFGGGISLVHRSGHLKNVRLDEADLLAAGVLDNHHRPRRLDDLEQDYSGLGGTGGCARSCSTSCNSGSCSASCTSGWCATCSCNNGYANCHCDRQ